MLKQSFSLNWNAQLEVSKKLYFQNLFWKLQNYIVTAVHFKVCNSEYSVLNIKYKPFAFLLHFWFDFFGNKILLPCFRYMIVNALLSSHKTFPFCQTNIFLCEVFSLGKENPLWIWIRLLLPRELVFSNTNNVPWGKLPVPSQSLGMERQLSSGRYFYLDNSSRIKHMGGRALTCVSVTVPLHSRDKAHMRRWI